MGIDQVVSLFLFFSCCLCLTYLSTLTIHREPKEMRNLKHCSRVDEQFRSY